MSLYGLLFGENDNANDLQDIIKLENYNVGRYRDIYLRDYTPNSNECHYSRLSPGRYIVLLTRNGGGNREDYEESINSLQSHPNYITDWDCDWDCTYAEFVFSIPSAFKDTLRDKKTAKDRGEAFDDVINAIKNK